MNIRHRDAFRPAHDNDALVPGARACAYLRVSTGRQAESDLSIPDQRKQVGSFAQTRNGRWSPTMSSPVPPPWTTTAPNSRR